MEQWSPARDTGGRGAGKGRRVALRVGLLFLLLAIMALAVVFVEPEAAFRALHQRQDVVTAWVEGHYVLAAAMYIGFYVLGVSLSVPGAVWFTIAGGFLFGTLPGALYTVIGGTTGALLVFVAARFIFGDSLRCRMGPFLRRMEKGFHRHAFNYMLVLRMLPLFPFWAVNVVPALLGVPFRVYALGTFLGIVPGTIIFASLGAGLGRVLKADEMPGPEILLDAAILGPLAGLAILALLPVLWARLRRKVEE